VTHVNQKSYLLGGKTQKMFVAVMGDLHTASSLTA